MGYWRTAAVCAAVCGTTGRCTHPRWWTEASPQATTSATTREST